MAAVPPKSRLAPESARWGAWIEEQIRRVAQNSEAANRNADAANQAQTSFYPTVMAASDAQKRVESVQNEDLPLIYQAMADVAAALDAATRSAAAGVGITAVDPVVLFQPDTPEAGHQNDDTLWIDTTNGLGVPMTWAETEWVAHTDPYALELARRAYNAFQAKLSKDAQDAAIEGAQEAAKTAAVLHIESSKGSLFKNNAISTVLTVTIYYGAHTITTPAQLQTHLGAGAYLEWFWRRDEDTDFSLVSSADARLSNGGFTFVVSPADVDEKTVFKCTVHD